LGSPAAPQSWNRYGYTKGNPITRLDPDGNQDGRFEIYHNYHANQIFSAESPEAREAAVAEYQSQNAGNALGAALGTGGVLAAIELGSGGVSMYMTEVVGPELMAKATAVGTFLAEIFNPNPTSLAPRPLSAGDFGLADDALSELKGTFSVVDDVAVVAVENIRGKMGNPFKAVQHLVDTARSSGASTLRIEGTLANDRLLKFLRKKFKVSTPPAGQLQDAFEITIE
jgi:hypothetical protein